MVYGDNDIWVISLKIFVYTIVLMYFIIYGMP